MQWVAAALTAFAVFNGIMFLIYHPVNEITRSGGSSPGLKVYPDYGLYGLEGYAIRTVDSRGYVNPDLPLAHEPYLVVGASHAEGFHTANGRRYSDILNERFGYTDSLKFYNISHSEFFLPDIVKRLSAMKKEFPDAKGLIIDIDSTAADSSQLEDAMDQLGFDEAADSYEALYSALPAGKKAAYRIKALTPAIREMSLQYQTFMKSRSGMDLNVLRQEEDRQESSREKQDRLEAYRASMGETLEFMASTWPDTIIVLHPGAVIDEDGSLSIAKEDTDDIFEELCLEYGISVIDMTDRFERAYEEDHTVPFGFMNTTMGSGHMNDAAHRMIADAVYEMLDDRGDGI